jgi:hypothetical protein
MKYPICRIWCVPEDDGFRYIAELEDDRWFVWGTGMTTWKKVIYKSFSGKWDCFADKAYNTPFITNAKSGHYDKYLILANLRSI